MYKTIDFTIAVTNEKGHIVYKPPAYCIGDAIKNINGPDYKIKVKFNHTSIDVFTVPILRQGSCFLSEKKGEEILIAKVYSDMDTNKIILYKCCNYKNTVEELPIPEVLFLCIRPQDLIQIEVQNENNPNISSIKYFAIKSNLENLGRIENVAYQGEFRFINKKHFAQKIIPKNKQIKKRKVIKWPKK
ncbi:hypothetical protein IJX73_02750 [bacterium]|nr:hypothetical protein [bacterium]